MMTATLETPEATKVRDLNRLEDRCDRCGAEAFILAVKEDSELLFCGHHGAKHSNALVLSGWTIQDERDRINTLPSPSANHDDTEEQD
jgi:ribosomal protein S27AE